MTNDMEKKLLTSAVNALLSSQHEKDMARVEEMLNKIQSIYTNLSD